MVRSSRILYVDDSRFDRELVQDALAEAGEEFQLVTVDSYPAFLKALEEGEPWDLVLTDFNIKGHEGMEVLDAVRKTHPDIPVVIVTGTGSEEIAAEALRRGVSDYVLKTPRQIRHLPVALRGVMERAQLAKARRRAIEEEEAALSILEATLEATADGLLVVDQDQRVIRANRKFFDMWGVPASLRNESDDEALLTFAVEQVEDPEGFLRTVRELHGDPTTVSTHQLRLRDGRIFERHSQPQRFGASAHGRVWSFRDITARIRAEGALKESEARYRTVVETAPDAIFIAQGETFAYVNSACMSLFGVSSKSELLGREVVASVHPEDQEAARAAMEAFQASNPRTAALECRIVGLDGALRLAEVVGTPIRFLGGQALQVLCRDITDRKRAEDALRESEENYRRLVESAPDPIFVEIDGVFAYLNPAAQELLGPGELVGRSVLDIVTTNYRGLITERLARFAAEQAPLPQVELFVRSLDGRLVEVEVTTTPTVYQGTPAARVFLRDVTERRAAQRALLKEKKFSDEAINSLPGVFYAFTPEGRFLRWNDNFMTVSGYSHEEIAGMTPAAFFAPEDFPPVLEAIQRVFKHGEDQVEAPFLCKDGRRLDYLFTGRRMQGESGPILVGMGIDLSSRKAVEAAMAESEDRYRTLVEQAPDCIFVASGGQFLYINPAGLRIFEAESESDLIGQSLLDRIHPEDRGRMVKRSETFYATGQPMPPEELRIQGLKGRQVVAEFTTTAIQYQGRLAARVFLKDVTSRRRAEEALKASEAILRSFFDSAPFQMGVTELTADEDVILVSVNEAVARLLGRTTQACEGLRISSLGIGGSSQGIWLQQYHEAWRTRGAVRFEYENSIPGADPAWFTVALAFIGETAQGRPRFSYVLEDISAQRAAEEDRRRAEERFRHLIENSADGLVLGLPEGVITYASPAASEILGYSEGELFRLNPYDLVHPEDLPRINELMFEKVVPNPGVPQLIQIRMRRKDDAWRWLEITFTNRLDDPSVGGLVVNFRDITDRKMEEILEEDRRAVLELVAQNMPLEATLGRLAALMEHQRPGMMAVVKLVEGGHIKYGVGPSLPPALLEAVQGTPVAPGMGSCEEAAHTGQPVLAPNIATHPSWIHRRELARTHQLRACWSHPVISASGQILGALGLYDHDPRIPEAPDVELLATTSRLAAVAIEHLQLTEQLSHQAQHDALTGLPNRLLFEDRLRQALGRAKRLRHHLAVLYMDLDRFKHINDTLGHGAGDVLLRAAAKRLESRTRQSDTLARMGGDEFTLVLTELKDPQDAARVAAKMLEAMRDPFEVEGHELFVSASIGISLFPDDGEEPAALQRSADTAMYRAKEKGRDNFQWFAAEMDILAHERMELEGHLRRAVEHGELFLLYQPQFRASDGGLLGFEALMRWRHPVLGVVSPARFIPLAEESGLIVPMGAWALREACAQMARWRDQGHLGLRVAVNVSAVQFKRPDWVDTVRAALTTSGIPPESLELEITESLLLQSATETTAHVFQLRDLGVAIAIDDFGTGYSSLSYLHRLPVTTLKIDQSFVRGIGTELRADREDAPIVRTIITLAHSLGMEVMAEGVETEAQLGFLRNLECEGIQGFLLGKPMDLVDAEALIRKGARTRVAAAEKAKPRNGAEVKPKPGPKAAAKPAPARAAKKPKAPAKKAGVKNVAKKPATKPAKKTVKKAAKKTAKRR